MGKFAPAWGKTKNEFPDTQGEIMDAPAFDATRFVRPVLLAIALYLSIIAISSMMMVKPAHASGTVPEVTGYSYGGVNYSSAAAVCEAPPFWGSGVFIYPK
jgi:hypothetical protein